MFLMIYYNGYGYNFYYGNYGYYEYSVHPEPESDTQGLVMFLVMCVFSKRFLHCFVRQSIVEVVYSAGHSLFCLSVSKGLNLSVMLPASPCPRQPQQSINHND